MFQCQCIVLLYSKSAPLSSPDPYPEEKGLGHDCAVALWHFWTLLRSYSRPQPTHTSSALASLLSCLAVLGSYYEQCWLAPCVIVQHRAYVHSGGSRGRR